jgi:hypothetical protein
MYRAKPSLEYDPKYLWKMFQIYWQWGSKNYPDTDLWQITKRQWKGYEIAITKPESLHHQSRRTGKTLKLSHLTIFFALLEFGPCHGVVIYRAPHTVQLDGYLKWLRRNPFFVRFQEKLGNITVLGCRDPCNANCISVNTSSGLECSVLLEDEYSTVKRSDKVMNINLKDCRAFLAKGTVLQKRHIHASSGRKKSPFFDDYRMMMEVDPTAYFMMTWQECPWITKEFVDKEKMRNFNAVWWVEEQYECKWVDAAGTFFDQSRLKIIGRDVPETFFKDKGIIPRNAGLDWNGPNVGHVLIEGAYHELELYLMHEVTFWQVPEVKQYTLDHPTVSLEVEGKPKKDAYNAGFSDHLQSIGCQCSYQGWDAYNGIKDYRLGVLQRMTVYVHPSCKHFIKNFEEASYDEEETEGCRLQKTADQHGLDACLHLIGTGSVLDVVKPTNFEQYVQYQKQFDFDMIRMRSRV